MPRGRKASLKLTAGQVVAFQQALQSWMETEGHDARDVAEMTGFSPEYINLLLGAYQEKHRPPSANVLQKLTGCGFEWQVSRAPAGEEGTVRKAGKSSQAKGKRRAADESVSLRLTDRDHALILFLARAELANRGQIERLFFPSTATANRRLRRLTAENLLRRYRPPAAVGGRLSGSHQFLYSLGNRGAALAAEVLGRAARKLLSGSEPPGELFLEHRLEVTEFMIRVVEAAGDRLVSWETEHGLRDEVPFKGGKRRFTPDAYIVLKLDAGSLRHAFVEVDRGTMRRRAWIQKARLYQAYYRSGAYQERYLTDRLLLLVVVPDGQRGSWIRHIVQGVEPLLMTFVANWQDIEAHTALGPAWVRYDTGERCGLLDGAPGA
jgi:hypothetical protein